MLILAAMGVQVRECGTGVNILETRVTIKVMDSEDQREPEEMEVVDPEYLGTS